LSGGIPPKSLGKSLSTQVLGADDGRQRGVHPQARVESSPSTHTLAQLGKGDVRIVSPATDAVSRPRNILQPAIQYVRLDAETKRRTLFIVAPIICLLVLERDGGLY
jgi:hypothetical protein